MPRSCKPRLEVGQNPQETPLGLGREINCLALPSPKLSAGATGADHGPPPAEGTPPPRGPRGPGRTCQALPTDLSPAFLQLLKPARAVVPPPGL